MSDVNTIKPNSIVRIDNRFSGEVEIRVAEVNPVYKGENPRLTNAPIESVVETVDVVVSAWRYRGDEEWTVYGGSGTIQKITALDYFKVLTDESI